MRICDRCKSDNGVEEIPIPLINFTDSRFNCLFKREFCEACKEDLRAILDKFVAAITKRRKND